ncbi:lipopolysaccharide biosynthesis protein [Rhodocista pekingensis]|uniref:Lipopolysaccharide biosynthesis protein n=1 Tax=Rhodocista pekingensis TaxID=201185 RepID=A0ABW2KUT9_9PROT
MNLRRLALEGAFWSSAEGWSRQLASLVIFVAVARLLSPAEIGLFAMVTIVLAAVQTVLDEGLNEVLIQREPLDDRHLDTAFWCNVALTGGICGALVLAAPLLARLFDEPGIAPLLQVVALAPLLVGLCGVQQALLRRQFRYRLLVTRSLAGIVAGGAVGILLAVQGYGAWALVAQQVVDRAVGAAVLWAGAGWTPRARFSLAHARDLMPYSAFLTATRIVNFCSKHVDRYLVGLLMGPAALGVYTLAYRVHDTLSFLIVQGVANVGMSTFARLQAERERMRRALYAAVELGGLLATPVFLGVSAVASNLVVTFFGEGWRESGTILAVIALLGVPGLVSNFAGAVIRATGSAALLLALLTASAVANVAVVLVSVQYGLVAVSIAILLRNVAFVPVYLWIMRRLIGVRAGDYLACFMPGFLAAAGMAVIVHGVGLVLAPYLTAPAALGVQVAVGLAVYGILLRLVAPTALARALAVLRHYRQLRSVEA